MTFRMDPTPSDHTGGFVAGDTRFALPEGLECTVADVVERMHRGTHPAAYALDVDGTVQMVHITVARRLPGDADVVAVTLDDGALVHCSPGQLLLSPGGEWLVAKDLKAGAALATLESPHSVVGTVYAGSSTRHVAGVARDGGAACTSSGWSTCTTSSTRAA